MTSTEHPPDERRPLRRDVLLPLVAEQGWGRVLVLESTGSTNTELLNGGERGDVAVADHQRSGRGRMTRRWEAPPRSSVALSVVLGIPERSSDWGWVPLLVGLAVRRAVRHTSGGVEAGLKWPNDVLARGPGDDGWGKLAGVLCQARADGTVVAGVGLNVDQQRSELPVETATSLACCGAPSVERERLVARLLAELLGAERSWRSTEGLALARDEYRRHCLTLGQDVVVHLPQEHRAAGRAVAVDDEGRLVVDHGAAGRTAYAVGDVVHVRPSELGEGAG